MSENTPRVPAPRAGRSCPVCRSIGAPRNDCTDTWHAVVATASEPEPEPDSFVDRVESFANRVDARLEQERALHVDRAHACLIEDPLERALLTCVLTWKATGDVAHLRRASTLLQTLIEIGI